MHTLCGPHNVKDLGQLWRCFELPLTFTSLQIILQQKLPLNQISSCTRWRNNPEGSEYLPLAKLMLQLYNHLQSAVSLLAPYRVKVKTQKWIPFQHIAKSQSNTVTHSSNKQTLQTTCTIFSNEDHRARQT